MRQATLPMYAYSAVAPANQALWDRIRDGVPGVPETLTESRSVPEDIPAETVFTQVCGYPLFRRFRGQANLLGIPRYDFEGCDGIHHRAAFIVREDDPATDLASFRGRVFGCNSEQSNTGMNLPRLSLARVAGGSPRFFRHVTFTSSHHSSLSLLGRRMIDLCSVDCVTWGLLQRDYPDDTAGLRVLEWTEPSPCLPFVTSAATPHAMAAALRANLLGQSEPGLGLVGVEPPDPAAYDILADYEQEAVNRGYPMLR